MCATVLFFILILTIPNNIVYFGAGMKLACAVLWIWEIVLRAQGNYLLMQSYVSDQIKTLNNGIIYNSIHWPMK